VVVVDHYGLADDWIAEVGAHLPVAVVDDWMPCAGRALSGSLWPRRR
jgi:hypothetical protein